MSGFNCTPSIIPPASTDAEPIITNDGWFPDVDPVAFRKQMRIRDSVIAERLREAILYALVAIGNNLADWRAARAAEGAATLADVPAAQLGGENRYVILYRAAIGAEAKARLVERYRDTDLTGAGQRQVSDLDESVGELRRDAIHAVRDILGRTHTSIELI
ncbi:head completion/stabilization protein [Sphingomonas sp. QA11]|uniref:head completion/stabilization protein n=1 Tax=Sphingomonas sp. QA11 TaxID=2950605 RepID=UPI00234A073D|nr:head completion/stabilization protein [Sphingomonas sp. QA11]WCM29184.1 head completion/stabilization protein [Sphingomonas sp. QA11]